MQEMCYKTDIFLPCSSRALAALTALASLAALSLEPLIEKTAALNTFVLIALDAILRAFKGV